MAMKTTCLCGKIIDYKGAYCEACTKERELKAKAQRAKREQQERYKQYSKVYKDKQWRKCTATIKSNQQGLCLFCKDIKRIGYVQEVHHIEEVNPYNNDLWYDLTNLIGLCEQCHDVVHEAYKKNEESKEYMKEYLRKLVREWQR